MAHVSTELLTNPNRTAANETLEFTVDAYRCGKCDMEFTLFEDFICHKLLVEKNNIVLCDSEKISGLQIPRFIESHGDYLQNSEGTVNSTDKNMDEIIPENLLNHHHVAPTSNTLAKKSQPPANSKKAKIDVSDRATGRITSLGRKSNKVAKSPQPSSHQLTSAIAKQRLNKHDPACAICGSIYRDFTTLKTHMKTVHSKHRPYRCGFSKCSCSFKTKASLQRHERRHTGERPFTCEQCGRTFRESGTLSRHLKARIPCAKKDDAELPRYGRSASLASAIINEDACSKNVDNNGTASAETLQVIITQIPGTADMIASNQQPEINKISSTGTTVDTNSTPQHQFSQLLEVASRLQPDSDQNLPEGEEDYVVVDPPYTLTPEMLRKALTQQFLDQNFHCIVCDNQYQQCSHLIHHIQQDHLKDYLHRCPQCFFVSKDRPSLVAHTRAKHDRSSPIKEQQQENKHWTQEAVMQLIILNDILDDQERQRNKNQNEVSKRNNGCHRCHVCLKKFKSRGYFAMHMGYHTGYLPHSCHLCQRAFISKDALEKHLISHSSQRSFKCEVCGKLFKRLNHMRDHFKTHNNEKHYFCKICGKGFKWPGALKSHELTHDRNVVFECESCDRRFKTRSTMRRHARRHQSADQASATRNITIQDALPCNENETSDLQLANAPDDAAEEQPTYFFILEDNTLSLIPAGLLDTENLWRQSQQPSGAEQDTQESQ